MGSIVRTARIRFAIATMINQLLLKYLKVIIIFVVCRNEEAAQAAYQVYTSFLKKEILGGRWGASREAWQHKDETNIKIEIC